jgi:hypothetical protein
MLAWAMWAMWAMRLKLIRLRDLRPCGREFVVNVDMWAIEFKSLNPLCHVGDSMRRRA